MGIQDVPVEILQHIVRQLENISDGVAIACTCRTFYEVVQPILCSIPIHTNYRTPLLLAHLLINPHLARQIRSVACEQPDRLKKKSIKCARHPRQMDVHLLSEADWTNIRTLLTQYLEVEGHHGIFKRRRYKIEDKVRIWVGLINHELNWDAVIATLLLVLPNLKHLSIGHHTSYDRTRCLMRNVVLHARTLQEQHGKLSNTTWALSNLHEVSVVCFVNDGTHIMPLLALPSVRKFWCRSWIPLRNTTTDDATLSYFSGIQDLTLNDCAMRLDQFRSVVSHCPQLRQLHIEQTPEYRSPGFSISSLIPTLSTLQTQLEELTLVSTDLNLNRNFEGSVPQLNLFTKLHKLQIEYIYLLGRHTETSGHKETVSKRCFDFTNLPPSLTQLTLRVNAVEPMGKMQPQVKKDLRANIDNLEYVPLLKDLRVSFTTQRGTGTGIDSLSWYCLAVMYEKKGVKLEFFSRWPYCEFHPGFIIPEAGRGISMIE